jgi:hypothetical protein
MWALGVCLMVFKFAGKLEKIEKAAPSVCGLPAGILCVGHGGAGLRCG